MNIIFKIFDRLRCAIEIRQLNTFSAIARYGSFTQAAEMLGYAQSSVTTQIQLLESELGTKLFERIGKSISLTPDGSTFLKYAQKIIALSEEARNAMRNTGILKGTLVVGTPESLCVMRLPGIFKEFHSLYPCVELIVKLDCGTNFQRMLRENTMDVAIFLGRKEVEEDFIVDLQFSEPMAVLAAPAHPLAAKDAVGPEDMQDQSLILTENGCTYRTAFESILDRSGVRARSILETGSVQAIKQLTADGLGISLLPQVAVAKELRSGSLVCLNWAGPDFGMFTQVIYHKDKWISPALGAFLELVKKIRP